MSPYIREGRLRKLALDLDDLSALILISYESIRLDVKEHAIVPIYGVFRCEHEVLHVGIKAMTANPVTLGKGTDGVLGILVVLL
jgi:hypothetical protein